MLQHQFRKCMSLLFEEIAISPKLEVCRAKKYDIRNQRPRLRRNRLFLGRKAGGFVNQLLFFYFVYNYIILVTSNLLLDTERLELFLNTKILFHILENLQIFVHLMHFRMFF